MRDMKGIVSLCLALALAGCAQAPRHNSPVPELVLARTIPLPGLRGTRPNVGVPGRIDHAAYDTVSRRLFVAALENCSLEVIDLTKGARLGSITNLSRPQGIAFVPSLSCAVVACGGDGSIHVFDTRTLKETKTFILGPDADNVRYDSAHDRILVCYGDENRGFIAVLDPHTWTRLREFKFESKPESFQVDAAGNRLFVNLPKDIKAVDDGQVAVVDLGGGEPLARIQLKGVARNFPMAFDGEHQRLFVAARRPACLIEIDAHNYEVIGQTPCTDDADDMFYDASHNRVLVIGGGFRPDLQELGSASLCSPAGETGAIDEFAVGSKGELNRLASTPTAPHARTGLYVPRRGKVYLAVPFRGAREAEIREYSRD